MDARCPPAENPMMPILAGSTPHVLALARTVRMARWASSKGTNGRPLGNRYSSTTPVIPWLFSHVAIPCPSAPVTSPPYPPPGQITTALPLGFAALWTVIHASAFSNDPLPIGAFMFHRGSFSGSAARSALFAAKKKMATRSNRAPDMKSALSGSMRLPVKLVGQCEPYCSFK